MMFSRCSLVAIVCALVTATSAQAQDETDYKAMYERANQSAALWKERATVLEKENKSLRMQIDRLLANPATPADPAAAAAAPAAQPAIRKEFTVGIPMGTTVQMENFGGPRRRLTIYGIDAVKITLQIDTEGRRSIPLAPGRTQILVDADSGDEVYLASPLVRNEGFGNSFIDLLIVKGAK